MTLSKEFRSSARKLRKQISKVQVPKVSFHLKSRRRESGDIAPDPAGARLIAKEFSEHDGPARIFYSTFSETFEVMCFEKGMDRRWPSDFCNTPDRIEIYRKTTAMSDDTVTADELELMLEETRTCGRGI